MTAIVPTAAIVSVAAILSVPTIFSVVGPRAIVSVTTVMVVFSFILWSAVAVTITIPIIAIMHYTTGQKNGQKANNYKQFFH